jgi:uncharacterized protein (DUF433 family)|tara:strand:+ start:409 stop:591 length:183 start_codon:yes stop_codon:yes gene_type:complete
MGKKPKLKTEDLPDVKAKLEAGIQLKDVADDYDYCDSSALRKAIKGLGYRVTTTLVPLEE